VPIIAKSDSLTLEERDAFKQKVGYIYFPDIPNK
jgi:septin family protein